jgi:L,D-transpeptidase ErfK/SrfK
MGAPALAQTPAAVDSPVGVRTPSAAQTPAARSTATPLLQAAIRPPLARYLTGGRFEITVARGDSLRSIGSRYGIDPAVLAELNGLRANARLIAGQTLQIDNRHLIPLALSEGILINVPQRMLFFFRRGKVAGAYPVSVGKPDWPTPRGPFEVLERREFPTWHVPVSIQREMARLGKVVKKSVPPGPENPLGDCYLALSIPAVGIHATIAPQSIYDFRTHGCIRLHPEHASALFDAVGLGESGQIIYEPVILGLLDDGRIFLEVHRDVYSRKSVQMDHVRRLAEAEKLDASIDWAKAAIAMSRRLGLATEVGLKPVASPSPTAGAPAWSPSTGAHLWPRVSLRG